MGIKSYFKQGAKEGAFIGSAYGVIAIVIFAIIFIGIIGYNFIIVPIQHEGFKNSTTYIDGHVQQLIDWKLDYEKASEKDKQAIKQVILQYMANFDDSLIKDQSLRQFLIELRNNKK